MVQAVAARLQALFISVQQAAAAAAAVVVILSLQGFADIAC
jgi:hypothetical protein